MGLCPMKFWRMHPTHIWLFIESNLNPEDIKKRDDWAELYAMLD